MPERLGRLVLPELTLDSGKTLAPLELAYSVNGDPAPDGSNVVLVVHALTGSHHLMGPDVPGLPGAWWDTMVGPGKALDTDRHCVVAFNNLCSPYGSTAPCTPDPATGCPRAMAFPVVSCRDMARAQALGLEALGIPRLGAVVGGSLGGMIALEWAAQFPERVDRCAVIAAPARVYPQAIAYNEVQRQAILADPDWREGNYAPGPGPVRGLSNARMLAMITYRSERSFSSRWMRDVARGNPHEWDGQFQVESYLHHHGAELVRRFDANCYLYLTRAMDLHDLAAGRGDPVEALRGFRGKPLLAVGIASDLLFPNWQVEEVARLASSAGAEGAYEEIESDNGHDSFLIDFDQLDEILRGFWLRTGF